MLDHQLNVERGVIALQRLDHPDRRVERILHAEHDLQRRGIVLTAEAFQIFAQPRLVEMQRLQQSGWRVFRGPAVPCGPEPPGEADGRKGIAWPTSATAVTARPAQ